MGSGQYSRSGTRPLTVTRISSRLFPTFYRALRLRGQIATASVVGNSAPNNRASFAGWRSPGGDSKITKSLAKRGAVG
jgi:hypothetical protein